jgi:hypothetical protein
MQLLWARYEKVKPPKYYLLLLIGETESMIFTLLSDAVPSHEAALMRKNKDDLKNFPPEELNKWLAENVPTAYKDGYRSFKKDELVIVNTYDVK